MEPEVIMLNEISQTQKDARYEGELPQKGEAGVSKRE